MKPTGPSPEHVRSTFSSIAHGYDRANDWMTFGMARLWRKQLVNWSQAKTGDRILDCATGTGDLAFEFARRVGTEGSVTGIDFCNEMLDGATAKVIRSGLKVKFQTADMLQLPFADNSFDVVSVAYGIRNVADPIRAMAEMYRVCRPGGRVMVLETGDTQVPMIEGFYSFYFKNIVPILGGLATGRRSAYEYLINTSQKFPSREKFTALLNEAAPFAKTEYKSLVGGASFLYRADKALT